MTEDQQRLMNFILETQARLSARFESMVETVDSVKQEQAEARKEAEERARRTDERWAQTEAGIRSLLAIAEIHEREIMELREHSRETDVRLNALVNTVERMISEGRNGKT